MATVVADVRMGMAPSGGGMPSALGMLPGGGGGRVAAAQATTGLPAAMPVVPNPVPGRGLPPMSGHGTTLSTW